MSDKRVSAADGLTRYDDCLDGFDYLKRDVCKSGESVTFEDAETIIHRLEDSDAELKKRIAELESHIVSLRPEFADMTISEFFPSSNMTDEQLDAYHGKIEIETTE